MQHGSQRAPLTLSMDDVSLCGGHPTLMTDATRSKSVVAVHAISTLIRMLISYQLTRTYGKVSITV